MLTTASIYTALSLLNLIGFVIGVGLLPPTVPIHFDGSMTADVVGSPWVLLALPAAAALVSAAIWTATLSQKPKRKAVIVGILSAVGCLLAYLGWVFFALIASGAEVGERAEFPIALSVLLPIALLLLLLGNFLRSLAAECPFGICVPSAMKSEKLRARSNRLGGLLLFLAGLLSAIFIIVFSCTAPKLYYVSLVVLLVSAAAACGIPLVYSAVLARREGVRERR